MNSTPLTMLTDEQKAYIDQLVMDKVSAMNSDQYLCECIDKKVLAMEAHIKAYFHERFHFHTNKNK